VQNEAVTTIEEADGLDAFQAARGRLFGIAYRMLGSALDAEDLVQDAWLRWQATDRSRVTNPGAFLARTVTNLSLNALEASHATREVYVGPWLPEPVFTGVVGGADGVLGPLATAEQRDTVSLALLRVLERLSPAERAAYVLREAFDYDYDSVAELIGTSEANARQLHSRARKHVAEERLGRAVEAPKWRLFVESFLVAAREGDLAALEALLAEDVVSRADGGGVLSAARKPVFGSDSVGRYIIGVLERFTDGLTPYFAEINGEPALVALAGTGDSVELRAIWSVTLADDKVRRLDMVLNPDKLAFASAQLSRARGLEAGLSQNGGLVGLSL
jgi:RNA polymerase sigma-70 factor (ECF subfamily)